MELRDRVIVITGGAQGIGAAMARRFAAEGARQVVLADLDIRKAVLLASEIGGSAYRVDVRREEDLLTLIEDTEASWGPIDLFCSNAGVYLPGGLEQPDDLWQEAWKVNFQAHLHAARILVPRMAARGEGYLLHTASAAGLLTQIGSAPYAVTKHAVVALAEWISVTHGDDGIRVSVLCPQAVRTAMTEGSEGHVAAVDGMLEPDVVAEAVVAGIREERFLILPHPEVAEYERRRAGDRDRWLAGMRRLRARYTESQDPTGDPMPSRSNEEKRG